MIATLTVNWADAPNAPNREACSRKERVLIVRRAGMNPSCAPAHSHVAVTRPSSAGGREIAAMGRKCWLVDGP